MNIFNLRQEHMEILSLLEEMEGEMTPELQTRWDILISNSEQKIKDFYWVYKHLQGQEIVIKEELNRIQVIKKRNENNMDRIKTTMDQLMKGMEIDAIKDGTIDVILAKSTQFNFDPDRVPKGYYEEVVTEKFKLAEFKAWCKSNIESARELCGAEFVEGKQIRIK